MDEEDGIQTPLLEILPSSYGYHVSHFETVTQGTGFKATLLVSAKNQDEAKQWLIDFCETSKTTWRVMRTCPTAGKYVLSKKFYRCHHGQQRKAREGSTRHSKDTDCCAKLTISVRRVEPSSGRKSRNSDPHFHSHPTLVTLTWVHNHAISIPAAIKFRDVSTETCGKLEELFRKGHSPSSALNLLELELQEEYSEDYIFKCADRSLLPDLKFCYRLYYKIFKRAYGASDGAEMLASVEQNIISQFNAEAGMTCAKMRQTSTQELIIAICTPMMQRIHSMMGHSSELVFIDSTGNVDRHGSRVFLLLTHSSSGGLPLGVLITSNEQEQTITEGLQLLKTILPTGAFGGNGEEGPAVFITDDCSSERKALHTVFPKSTLLLCTFHLLQAVWRWLWDSKHGINKDHRQSLFIHVKQMMYAKDTHDVETAYQLARQDPTVIRYHGYGAYLESLYDRRQVWAQAFRLGLPIRANNTNNYAEAAMRVLKDSILQRTKAFNVPQLVDFILCRLENFYQRRLLAVVNQRPMKWRIQPRRESKISKDDISKTGESTYQVISQSDRECHYTVDMAVGVCSCHEGVTGGACKHQEAIVRHFKVASSNFLPTSAIERTLLLKIATGRDDNVPPGWLDPLQSSQPMAEDVAEPELHDMPVPQYSGLQDPQLVRVDSLRAQRDLLNAFDRRLHGNVSSVSNSQSSECENLLEGVREMFRDMEEKLQQDPETFAEPFKAMVTSYRRLKTNNNLVSALKMFGRYNGINLARRKLKAKTRGAGMQQLQVSGPSINVQPTAIARRRVKIGGKRRLAGGRPTKQAAVTEHGYARHARGCQSSQLPRKKRMAAPHSLSHAVTMCQSLGKTHSAK